MDFVALGYEPDDVEKYIAAGSDAPPPTQEQILAARNKLVGQKPGNTNQTHLHEICF